MSDAQQRPGGPDGGMARLLALAALVVLVAVALSFAGRLATRSPAPAQTAPATPAADTAERADAGDRVDERLAMAETIAKMGVEDTAVLEAMRAVPRHRFVPDEYLSLAYANRPLPIGYGQTISQPYMVAYMTEQLALEPGERILEVGTGSGYQAAVLAALEGIEVYSVEIVPELASSAARRLDELGYADVHVAQRDGYYGWEEHAPYDAIIVTAAPDHLPQPLVAQLAPGGRIVIPIGPAGSFQTLWRFVRDADGLRAENLGGVIFVPFTGAGVEGATAPSEPSP